MGARSVYFTDEMEDILKQFKETDPNFKLSDFVKKCMIEDSGFLTEDQIAAKITNLENDKAKADLEITHLKSIVPLAKKKAEELDEEQAERIDNAMEVLIRKKGAENFEDICLVHAKLTGLSTTELMRMADELSDKQMPERTWASI